MATAMTISASNPLANPLRRSSYGGRRKASRQLDGASVYQPKELKSYSLPPSPILVVVPTHQSISSSSSLSSSTAPSSTPATPAPTGSPLKLSYADVLRSSGPLNKSSALNKSSGAGVLSPKLASPLASSTTQQAPPPSKNNMKMDKKLDFEEERAKLKARRLAKKGYEKQTGKRWDSDMSHQEWEIYQAQVKLHEEAIALEKQNHEEANALAASIKYKETVLQQLQTDLADKHKQIEAGKEALERFRLDMEESIRQALPSSSSIEKSSSVRMKEEQQKKKLRSAWRNAEDPDDPQQKTRRDVLVAQEEVAALNLRIINLKKELNKMKEIAAREASSKLIMRAEKKQRDDMKKAGIEKPKPEPKPKPPPKAAEPRSHHQRMADQKKMKEKARAERKAAAAAAPSS